MKKINNQGVFVMRAIPYDIVPNAGELNEFAVSCQAELFFGANATNGLLQGF
jgi:hypothetical protein